MTIEYTVIRQNRSLATFVVSLQGMNFTIEAGGAKIMGVQHSFLAHSLAIHADADDSSHVYGWLVRAKSDGAVSVLIDEVVLDGVDEPYLFGDASLYLPVVLIFSMDLPAATTALDDPAVTIKVQRYTSFEEISGDDA